jgi:hypothetical protein
VWSPDSSWSSLEQQLEFSFSRIDVKLLKQITGPEMTNTSSGHFRGGRGKPVYPGRLTASRERSGRQAFPPVIALRLSVAQNP